MDQLELKLRKPLVWWGLITILLVTGAGLRLYDLTADLPAYFTSKSQDLTTDGSFLTLYARNAIEQGEWDPAGYAPWRQFKLTLVTGVSYLIYHVLGVSRYSSHLVGLLLSSCGLVFFLFGLASAVSRRSLLFAAVALAASYPLIIFSRTPLAENSLIFFLGILFFVFMRWSDRWWGMILLGVLCAAAGLVGKVSGSLFLAAPLLYLIAKGQHGLRPAVLLFAVTAVVSIVYSSIFFADQGLFSFLFAHAVDQAGTPVGLSSPLRFIETVISFGRSRIHQLAPVESILAFFALTTFVFKGLPHSELARKLVLFNVGLLVIWVLGVAPFNYLPMRYALLILPSLTALSAVWFDSASTEQKKGAQWIGWPRAALLILLNWYFCYVVANWLISDSMVYEIVQKQVWFGLLAALIMSGIELLILSKTRFTIGVRAREVLMPIAIAGVLTITAVQIYAWFERKTHTIDEAVRDMKAIVGPDAVIGGPYGPVLADGNGLTGFPLFIAEDFSSTRAILQKYPVTHLAVLNEDWQRLSTTVAELNGASVVARYWLRDNVVTVIRIAGLFNTSSKRYQLSSYELALLALDHQDRNTAYALLRTCTERYTDAKSPAITLYHSSVLPESMISMQSLVDRLLAANSTDFTVNLLAAVYYRHLAATSPTGEFQARAEELKAEALRLCPENETVVQNGFKYYDPTDRILR